MLKDCDVIVEPDIDRADTIWIIPLSERARGLLGTKPYAALADDQGVWSEIDQHRLRTLTT